MQNAFRTLSRNFHNSLTANGAPSELASLSYGQAQELTAVALGHDSLRTYKMAEEQGRENLSGHAIIDREALGARLEKLNIPAKYRDSVAVALIVATNNSETSPLSTYWDLQDFEDGLRHLLLDNATEEGLISDKLARLEVDPDWHNVEVQLQMPVKINFNTGVRVGFKVDVDLDEDPNSEAKFYGNNNKLVLSGSLEFRPNGAATLSKPIFRLNDEPEIDDRDNVEPRQNNHWDDDDDWTDDNA